MAKPTQPQRKKARSTARQSTVGESVRVRMYRQGLGDCFLLTFPKERVGESFHVLIDCGVIGVAEDPRTMMQAVASDINEATGGRIDLAVITHEHWDHVSGFSPQQAHDIFENITVDQVWYAWTEDPLSALGRKIRAERAAKIKVLEKAASAFALSDPTRAKRFDTVLGFFGLGVTNPSGKVRPAFDYLAKRKGIKVRYCRSLDAPQSFPGVPGVCVYVLGPPENEALIKQVNPTASRQDGYSFGADSALEENLLAAFDRHAAADVVDGGDQVGDADLPFDAEFYASTEPSPALQELRKQTWDAPGQVWRRVDDDWMAAAETLALALDKYTNNTSLALAFELVASGRVLLFAADAQVGNWLSWQDAKWEVTKDGRTQIVTGPDLLKRTVLYKVGHHGSHNATLREKGLEQMISPELIALVPVNVAQARKNRWMDMPAEKLVVRLREKARGRVIYSDADRELPAVADLGDLTTQEQSAFLESLRSHPGRLYHELTLKM